MTKELLDKKSGKVILEVTTKIRMGESVSKMTYEELVAKLQASYKEYDASQVQEHLAIQFNVEGEAEGALYLEISDGQIHVEPYEYYDRDILVRISAQNLLALADGTLDIMDAYSNGKLSAEGYLEKAMLLNIITKKKAKEEGAKTEEPEKEVEEVKPEEVKAEEPVKTTEPATPEAATVKKETPAPKTTGMSRKKNRKRRK